MEPNAKGNPALPHPQAALPTNSTVLCHYCQIPLTYPSSSVYIQCPKCMNTMDPRTPRTSFIHCLGCRILLSHPPASVTIQCPKCYVVMELPMHGGVGDRSAHVMIPEVSRKKKRKDPTAPKRASNAYMIFCKETRAKLKVENPGLPFGKIGSKLGEMWRNMNAESKKPFEERARRDRERYKHEMSSYHSQENPLKSEGNNEATQGHIGHGNGPSPSCVQKKNLAELRAAFQTGPKAVERKPVIPPVLKDHHEQPLLQSVAETQSIGFKRPRELMENNQEEGPPRKQNPRCLK